MNILLINVCLRPTSPEKLFPVGLGYIATAMHNAGFAFDLIDIDAHRLSDEEVERRVRSKKYDVACMGCIVTGYKFVKQLAQMIRSIHKDCTIIAGNSVATSIVDTLLQKTEVDVAVLGEGDVTIVELLSALEKGAALNDVAGICFKSTQGFIRTSPRPFIKDISSLPLLNHDLFDIAVYVEHSKNSAGDPIPVPREDFRAMPCNTARGCIGKCTFCYHNFLGLPYRYRSSQSIVHEIQELIAKYRLNFIFFWDELTFFSKSQVLEFAELVLNTGLEFGWSANCRGNLFDSESDLAIIEKMKQAGCASLGYSLESSDPHILQAMNKHVSVEEFARQTELLHKGGITTYTSLVFGFPEETPETIRKTIDCCIANQIYPSAGFLLPQPGSEMYRYAIDHGFIVDEEDYLLAMGDRQDLRLNMTAMSDEEFEQHVVDGLARCNEALNLGLPKERLVKSLHYRAKKDSQE